MSRQNLPRASRRHPHATQRPRGGEAMKKTLVALVVGLVVATSAKVAMAYVAVVATAVPVTATVAEDRTQLDNAVASVIRDVLQHAIGFTPTVVTLEKAAVAGDRLYILLFIADQDGESIIEALATH